MVPEHGIALGPHSPTHQYDTTMDIQFITHHNSRYSELEGMRLALEGGCRWVQLRMKEADDDIFLAMAREARTLCSAHGATLILDDRAHLVEAAGADGVHLGRLDMPVDEARQLLGPRRIIGGTANTMADIRRLAEAGANYIGCGPLRFTTTKKNLAPLLGFDGYRRLIAQMRAEGIDLPLVAIGGITEADLPLLAAAGVSGIAVSGSVLGAPHPTLAMQSFMNYGE